MTKRVLAAGLFGTLLSFGAPQAAFSHEGHEGGHEAAQSQYEACRAEHPQGDCGTEAEAEAAPGESNHDQKQHDDGATLF